MISIASNEIGVVLLAAYDEQRGRKLIALSVGDDEVDLVCPFIEVRHAREIALVVDIDKVTVEAHNGSWLGDANDGQISRIRGDLDIPLGGLENLHEQWRRGLVNDRRGGCLVDDVDALGRGGIPVCLRKGRCGHRHSERQAEQCGDSA